MTREELLARYPDADERMQNIFNLLMSAAERAVQPAEPSSEPPKPKATRAMRKPKSSE